MTVTKTKPKPKLASYKFAVKSAQKLVVGDRVLSASGKVLVVSLVVLNPHRTIVLFNGDMEIDFDPWCQISVITN